MKDSMEKRLARALEDIVGPLDKRDRWGYGAAANAMDDEKRIAALILLEEFHALNDGDESLGDA